MFCKYFLHNLFMSMYAGLNSFLHTVFFIFSPFQLKPATLRQLVPQRLNRVIRLPESKKVAALFLISVFCFLAFGTAHAASVTLALDRSQEPNVIGYRV